jgi:hypothetical protein
MPEKRMNKELAAVEAALAALKPAASLVDRDRLMFLAGRASAAGIATGDGYPTGAFATNRKAQWLWPCLTAVSLLLALVSTGALMLHGPAPAKNAPQKLWYEDARLQASAVKPQRRAAPRHDMAISYFALNRLIAEEGADALPGPTWVPLGRENVPRRGPTVQDELKMF